MYPMQKTFEIFGTLLAAAGFLLLSFNMPFHGFTLGIFSCVALIPILKNQKLYALLGLQLFFLIANIIGLINNWN